MNKIAPVKSQLRLQERTKQIDECQSSNMSVTDWCSANGIATNTYYYRLKKVREHTLELLPDSSSALCEARFEISFKKLEVKTSALGLVPAVIVHLPQATIEVPEGISQHTIEAVLLALRTTCQVISALPRRYTSHVDIPICESLSTDLLLQYRVDLK